VLFFTSVCFFSIFSASFSFSIFGAAIDAFDVKFDNFLPIFPLNPLDVPFLLEI
jgi:hypothetical protein